MAAKKLIEVALPLEKINAESAREKSIRHGHPSTLHLWWARRPLAAARAVIWSSLVDDPSSHPELFPTEEEQAKERERLFKILEDLVIWENSNDELVLSRAKAEIMKYTDGNPPALLDPFAGGGAIPLEAQRLGLEAHGHDLNPVAVMINKAMIEIPPRFAALAPVNPEARSQQTAGEAMVGAAGLAEDVRYYGQWMKDRAFARIGHLYPKVKVPKEQGGGEATVIAWIWARTVKCPNPACGCEMPLVRSFVVSKKRGKEAYIVPKIIDKKIEYEVKLGKGAFEGTVARTGARCIFCSSSVSFDYIRDEAKHGRMDSELMAVIAEGESGRIYASPDEIQRLAARCPEPTGLPETVLPEKALGFRVQAYGMTKHKDLFSNRQLTALVTLCNLVSETQKQAELDAVCAGRKNDHVSLAQGGAGARAYGEAIGVYLAFLVDQVANHSSTICSWNAPNTQMRNTFARQAIPMVWDYAECNIFSHSTGSYNNLHERLIKAFDSLGVGIEGKAEQFDAKTDCGLRKVMISTDPPYYDNIGYADLSDFFYVWLRLSIKGSYPEVFRTVLVPKSEELIATPFRFDGSSEQAKEFFEQGMLQAFQSIAKEVSEDIPVTIYYAFKQNDAQEEEEPTQGIQSASSGWETMLSAVIHAGFSITGTWPMRTEKPGRSVGIGTNALSSSVVLVCRKRAIDAPICTRRNIIAELKRELRPALKKLQDSNIAPVDLAQSAIGPGMGVFSKYSKVLEADGTEMTVRSALQIINQELDVYFNEQDGELDRNSRFCVELYMQSAFNDMKYGDADTLARAKNTSVPALAAKGILYAQKGIVHLFTREEIPETVDTHEGTVWLVCQLLTHAMEKGGVAACANIVAALVGPVSDRARDLAYRLYTVAERKGWTQEAYAYNALVVSWPDVQSLAAEIRANAVPVQQSMFD